MKYLFIVLTMNIKSKNEFDWEKIDHLEQIMRY